jgi:hypothetical protein
MTQDTPPGPDLVQRDDEAVNLVLVGMYQGRRTAAAHIFHRMTAGLKHRRRADQSICTGRWRGDNF